MLLLEEVVHLQLKLGQGDGYEGDEHLKFSKNYSKYTQKWSVSAQFSPNHPRVLEFFLLFPVIYRGLALNSLDAPPTYAALNRPLCSTPLACKLTVPNSKVIALKA